MYLHGKQLCHLLLPPLTIGVKSNKKEFFLLLKDRSYFQRAFLLQESKQEVIKLSSVENMAEKHEGIPKYMCTHIH